MTTKVYRQAPAHRGTGHCSDCNCPTTIVVEVKVDGPSLAGERLDQFNIMAKALQDAAMEYRGDFMQAKITAGFEYDISYMQDKFVLKMEQRA